MALLPPWLPTDALLIALVAFIVAVLLLNKGAWWFVNVLAQDEPAAVAIGVFIAALALSGRITDILGFGTDSMWFVVGVLVVLAALTIYQSDRWDISNLL